MIVAADILRNLRKTNISVNADKTQQRIKEDFSSASRAVKKEIETLSGQTRQTFYRAYSTGR